MATAWSAGEHDCKVFFEDGTPTLRCKCGWDRLLSESEAWSVDQPWRIYAKDHCAV